MYARGVEVMKKRIGGTVMEKGEQKVERRKVGREGSREGVESPTPGGGITNCLSLYLYGSGNWLGIRYRQVEILGEFSWISILIASHR